MSVECVESFIAFAQNRSGQIARHRWANTPILLTEASAASGCRINLADSASGSYDASSLNVHTRRVIPRRG